MRLNRLLSVVEHSEPLARTAAITSMGSTTFAWLGVANEFLTALATIIAIVSGIFAARFYYNRSKYYCLKVKEEQEK